MRSDDRADAARRGRARWLRAPALAEACRSTPRRSTRTLADAAGARPYSGPEARRSSGARSADEFVARRRDAALGRARRPARRGAAAAACASPPTRVVVVRTAPPQTGETARFLARPLRGLVGAGVPAVGVEETTREPSAVRVVPPARHVDRRRRRHRRRARSRSPAPARGAPVGAVRRQADRRAMLPADRAASASERRVAEPLDDPRRRARRGGARSAATVAALRRAFPGRGVDRRRRRLARRDRRRRARRPARRVLRLPRRGKGQALSLAERAAPPGRAAPLRRRPRGRPRGRSPRRAPTSPSRRSRSGRAAASGSRSGTARALIRLRAGLRRARAALGPARRSRRAARAAVLPARRRVRLRDADDDRRRRARGLRVEEVELPLGHRATGRDVARVRCTAGASSSTRCSPPGRSASTTAACGCRSSAGSFGAARTPASPRSPRSGSPTTSGRPRARLPRAPARRPDDGRAEARRDPAGRLRARRELSGALLVGLAANALNQLDTRRAAR